MPKKIRELEASLKKAGFVWNPGKGSHRKWDHGLGVSVVISGKAGNGALPYQEKDVRSALKAVEEKSKQKKQQP